MQTPTLTNNVTLQGDYLYVRFDFDWEIVRVMQSLKGIHGWRFNKAESYWAFPASSSTTVREALAPFEFTWSSDLPSPVITYRHKKAVEIRDNNGLQIEQVSSVAPSVFAEVPHASRSESYLFIPTIQILENLQQHGYHLTYATQSSTTVEDHRNFTRHLLRLRHTNYLGVEEAPEIIIINAHNGGAAFRLLCGFFRTVCSNGLVTGDLTASIRVRHMGNILNEVLQTTVRVTEEAEERVQIIDAMRQIPLSRPEQLQLAQYAISQRWPKGNNVAESTLVRPSPEDLLQPKRDVDKGTSLWTTFNVIQEWMITGGIYLSSNGRRTQKIRGIDQSLSLNSLLWMEAYRLFMLKQSKFPRS